MRNVHLLLALFMFCYQLSARETPKTIHVYVALCDNLNQGIVPVPESLGNGQDPKSNLYWGAMYGIKTYFKNSKDWKLVSSHRTRDTLILEQVLFKHKFSETYLLAEAYNGKHIQQTTVDFLEASAGRNGFEINVDDKHLCFGGDADLVAYIGHNGLMEFTVNGAFDAVNNNPTDAIILACYSKSYFTNYLKITKANPLVWSTHLMAPEAYVLKYAIDEWISGASHESIAINAAKAYSKYQKCSLKTANRLLVTGD